MKKIVIFGGQQITIDCLEILRRNKQVKIIAVVGCERKEDRIYGYPSIKDYCQKNHLLFFQPDKLDKNFLKLFKNMDPDLALSLYYRSVFQKSFLSVPPMGFINIHPSLLPKYRGPVPSLWALLNNEKVTGVTLNYIDEGIDTGDIIEQITFKIPGSITGFELNNKLMKAGVKLFHEQLPLILSERNKRIKQDNSQATYFGPFHSDLRKINWFSPTEKIIRQILAFTKPYSGAIAYILEKEIIIWKARKISLSKQTLSGPGKIVRVLKDNQFIVFGVNGCLLIKDFEIIGIPKNTYHRYIKIGNRFALWN